MQMKEKKNSSSPTQILDAEAIRRALRRIAHEIIEQNADLKSVVLAGIPLRGVEIARRLAEFIREVAKIDIETGTIDVAMHRDDVGTRAELPMVHASKLPLPLEDRTVIIIDDVLFTGRTVRAAIRLRAPRYARYAAPPSFSAMNAVGERSRISTTP